MATSTNDDDMAICHGRWKLCKNGQKKIRLHKTHTGRAGQHFMNFFTIFCFSLKDGFPKTLACIFLCTYIKIHYMTDKAATSGIQTCCTSLS